MTDTDDADRLQALAVALLDADIETRHRMAYELRLWASETRAMAPAGVPIIETAIRLYELLAVMARTSAKANVPEQLTHSNGQVLELLATLDVDARWTLVAGDPTPFVENGAIGEALFALLAGPWANVELDDAP